MDTMVQGSDTELDQEATDIFSHMKLIKKNETKQKITLS